MTDQFIIFLVDKFYELEKNGSDGFLLIKLSVPMKTLFELYERLVKVDVPPIESIPVEDKLFYWYKSKQYYTEEHLAIKASKAAYVLKLITQ